MDGTPTTRRDNPSDVARAQVSRVAPRAVRPDDQRHNLRFPRIAPGAQEGRGHQANASRLPAQARQRNRPASRSRHLHIEPVEAVEVD